MGTGARGHGAPKIVQSLPDVQHCFTSAASKDPTTEVGSQVGEACPLHRSLRLIQQFPGPPTQDHPFYAFLGWGCPPAVASPLAERPLSAANVAVPAAAHCPPVHRAPSTR